MTCSDSNKECMYRECGVCRERKAPRNEFEEEKQVTWPMWKNRRIEKTKKNPAGESITKMVQMTVKEDETGTLTTLADAIDNELERAARHIFNIRHQYTALRYLREHLTNEDVVLHIDFSENYNCKYKSEIQSVHFGASQRQISLHTGVAYTKESTYPFTTMSDCLKHSPAAIWAHLDPVIDFLKSESDVNTIHFISDGPTTQYRNKQNFYLFSTRIYDKGFRGGTWNFLEAGHGKGAADGIGAAIKRLADKVVQRRGQDITCAQDLLNGVDATDTKVKMFLVKESDISRLESALPSKLVVVKDTMKIHQVVVHKKSTVSSRVVSCFCRGGQALCDCYLPLTTCFHVGQHQDIAVGASGDGPTCPPLKAVDVSPSLQTVVGPTEGQTIVAGPTEGQTTVVGPTEGQTIVAGPTEGQTIVAGPRACLQWTDQGPVGSGPTEGQSTVPVIEPSEVVGPSEGQTTVVGPTEGQTILVGPRASLQLTDQGPVESGPTEDQSTVPVVEPPEVVEPTDDPSTVDEQTGGQSDVGALIARQSSATADTHHTEFVKKSAVSPLPKAAIGTRKSYRGGNTVIPTTSPYKRELEHVEETQSNDRPNKKTKTKQIKNNTVKIGNKKSKANNTDTTPCLYCNELYKDSAPGEIWIQCHECKDWAHEQCSGNEGGVFFCEICTE